MKKIILFFFLAISIPCFSQTYNQIAKIVASDRGSGDQFGSAVAISGNYAVAGAHIEAEDTSGNNTLSFAGSAYVFEKNANGIWKQKQKLVPSDRAASDYFGGNVAIDGNRIVVGAYEKNAVGGNTYTHAGAAYIFDRDVNGVWQEVQKLVASDTSIKSHFGYSVAVKGDYVIIGAPLESEDSTAANTLLNAGAAYVFKRDMGGNWNQVKKFVSYDRAATDYFGIAVGITDSTIFIGANREDEDSVGLNTISESGSVYVFKETTNGQWYQSQKLVSSDRAATDRFGTSLSLSNNKAVIGAYLEDENATGTNTMSAAGSAYIFEKATNGKWYQKQKIVASDRSMNDYFGISVSISDTVIVVGAEQESEDASGGNTVNLAGSAYIFHKNVAGIWSQKQKIVSSDRAPIDLFGHSVALSDKQIIVAAHVEDEDQNGNSSLNGAGSAYIFEACINTSYSFYDTACFSYTSPSGNYHWTSSNTYVDTIPNAKGCDSILTIYLTIYTVNTTINSNGATLTANANPASYQWLDCNNNYSAITGATNQSYTAVLNGDYAVIITENGCIDTSACYNINSVGINDEKELPPVTIFPNPSSGTVYINAKNKILEIKITDISGNIVCCILPENKMLSTTINLAKGLYFVHYRYLQHDHIKKLIIN